MTTARATVRNMFSAVDDLAEAFTAGIPCTANGKPLMYEGHRLTKPDIDLTDTSCRTVDAIASLLLGGGHRHAARMAIAAHTEADTSEDDSHHAGAGLDDLARVAYADQYLNDLTA